jgi:probable phosphoglycerate mutase
MTELYLLRHGETEWNRALRFQGQIDVPLNDVGHAQAQRLAKSLVRRLESAGLDALVCSDLLRARQTAEPLADALGLACTPMPGLREQNFGQVDGMKVEDIQAQFPREWAQWILFDADYALPGAESARQFHQRVMAALGDLVTKADHHDRRLAVVTHGGVLDMIYRSAKGLSLSGPRECQIPNAAVNRLNAAWVGGQLQLTIEEWADVAHLADMPPQPVYDQARLAKELSPKAA